MNLLSEKYSQEKILVELQQEFACKGYVKLPSLLNSEAFSFLQAEVKRLEQFVTKRNFTMPGYETPRLMSILGGRRILQESLTLWSLYSNYEVVKLIQAIIGGKIYPCLHGDEFMIMNCLLSNQATHGWHLDDTAYVLTLIFEAPPVENGGLVEFVQGWREWCSSIGAAPEEKIKPAVEKARAENLIQVKHHLPGDAYLLRADQCLHRVTELVRENICRVAVSLAYEATPDPKYGFTATRLYSEI
ncbi:hypothetical protein DP113_11710 [Brasilonema octagenarum UFV-E1]|uniref:Fe2OG dioxygenase domain-containing protein n=2 Tax=Brasilonema TaxID=383614 RepID=A0A856MFN1_9CYAN|nr:hypothetical protein DP114_11770 [Brasilonema sennae CENA114]QDL14837.1 hypothetical protein DP113_11710 [Brasilonema octagenarum UFV-E1]